ncbi:MAG: restriction endonuclease subunit S [Vescimonas sp.]
MTKKSDAPAIRFKEFSDAWEQRKAIDIADYSKGNGYSKGDLTDAGTPIILYGRLYTKYQFAISEVDTFAFPRNGAVYSQGNEVIVPASGETAEDIARASAVEKSGVLLGGDLNILRPFDFINPLFLALAISNGEPQKELAKKAQGKSVVHIHNTDIQEVTIAYPSRTEQDRIVSVFRQLDNLITLHQRKFEKLTNVKKSMLEKMFPQNGSSYPEIRFKGFTDPWEQRKFSELVQIERGGSPRPIDDFITDAPNGLNWVKIGDAPTQGNYITKTAEKIRPEGLSKTREVHPGDLILSNSMSFGKPYIMGIDGCIHDGWLLIRNTYGVFDLTFLCHLLGTPQMLSQYRSLAAGSTVNNLNKELVGNTYVTIPSITEQRVLGAYLEQLDNLITLHQRELEKLQKIKKSMLEKMFV